MTEEVGPRQRAAETKRKRTREWIIMSTLNLYGDLDRGDFTRDQLAEAAGVGVATIHNHFHTKYEVLSASYDTLLSPVTEATHGGGLDELIRYVYRVAKLSQDHRALTVAMVRAYFEVAPEYRRELHDPRDRSKLHLQLGGSIAVGMMPIVEGEPFDSGSGFRFVGHYISGVQLDTVLYHSTALLLSLYHSPGEDAPRAVTHTVLSQLLSVILPGFKASDLGGKITGIVDERP